MALRVAREEIDRTRRGTAARSLRSGVFFTGPIVFHSACSRLISAAAASQSVDSASASAFAQSASFFARFSAHDRLALGEIGVAAREEAIAGGAEALPDRLLLAAADRADRLPLGLQLLDLVGGLNPVGRVGERLGALAERDLLREVLGARLGLRREMRLAARPRLVVRRLEAAPQRFALRARHVGGLPPLLLQLAHLLGDRLGILDRLERLHLLAELLLDPDVRPALPVGDVAQLLHLRHQRGLRRLQPADDLVVVALRRQLRHGAERGADVLQRALAGLERQIGARGQRLDAADAAAAARVSASRRAR